MDLLVTPSLFPDMLTMPTLMLFGNMRCAGMIQRPLPFGEVRVLLKISAFNLDLNRFPALTPNKPARTRT